MAGNLWKACNVVMHHLTQNSLGGIAYCMWSVNYNNKSVMHPIRKNCKINNFINMACFVSLTGKNEAMESWPTSPVLSEETNVREKEKAHRYYERQLKACSWYSTAPRPSWIEIAQPFDGDNCSQCCYKESCGCVIVSNEPISNEGAGSSGGERRLTVGSVRSSLGEGQRFESRTSTEDSKSFYDNLCDFCKVTSLERRSRKYGEWRRRWSVKVHGNATREEEDEEEEEEDEAEMCTCAMDHLSFIEWKQLYEQNDLVTFSKVDRHHDRAERLSTSDYGTQKSKDSEGGTVACREYPVCLTVKTPSLGYNSSCSIPNTEQELDSASSCSLTVVSDSEGSNIVGDTRGSSTTSNRLTSPTRPARTPHAFHGFRGHGSRSSDDDDLFDDKLSWILPRDTCTNSKHKPKSTKNKTSNSRRKNTRLRRARPKDTTSSDHPHRETTSNSEASAPCSEGETFCGDGKTTFLDGSPSVNGLPSICVTETEDDDAPKKIPTENDETLPADLLSEFLLIAKSIDEFYENIHAKKFLENRVESTKCDSVEEDTTEKSEICSQELKDRIRSLERLCSFVDQSDEDASIRGGSPSGGKRLSSIDKEQPVWKLSQQSLDLMHSRRSRSTSSGSSSNRSRCSTSGSRSSNSRCSTRQSDHANGKLSETSTENMRSPDSGFSEKPSLSSEGDLPDACQLGTKWAGSMQWDYTDWYFIGYDSNGERPEVKEQSLTTIHEAPLPQDPLDWDW